MVSALAACACLVFISHAEAAWQPAPLPPGEISSVLVANSNTWLADLDQSPCCALSVTGNRGATWTPVSFSGFTTVYPVGAVADGSFRVVTLKTGGSNELQVVRIDPAGGTQPLGPPIASGGKLFSNVFAVGPDGSTWVPYYDGAVFKLAIVGSDGSVDTKTLPTDVTAYGWFARPSVFGMRLVRVQEGTFRTETLKLTPEGAVVPAETYPVEYADGDFWLSASYEHASWDGGAHWSETELADAVVQRAPGLGTPRYLLPDDSNGAIAEPYSSELFRNTALTAPPGTAVSAMVDVGSGLVVWRSGFVSGGSAIFVHDGPLPPIPTEVGQLPADARALIDRANLFRSDAGLPPLVGDALISQASHNHSAYSALHPSEGLAAHHETPGLTGFTGADPSDRCAAVGAVCGSEIMFSPVDDPVGGWLATVYHRPLLGSPEAGNVGGGKAPKGWFVMNGGASQSTLIRPFGYPVGRWRGDSGFAGEVPDPIDVCKKAGQPIEYPVGITVTLYLPQEAGDVKRIEVRKQGDSKALPGCLIHDSDGWLQIGHFVLDDPLEVGKTYNVHGEWTTGIEWRSESPSENLGTLAHDWSFTYDPEVRPKPRTKRHRTCGGKRVTLLGTGKRDVIRGTKRRDVIDARGGNDVVKGLKGRDVICGGPGRDRLIGGAGRDLLLGARGNDRESGGPGGDKLYGGGGRDRLSGGPGRDLLSGGPGRDRYSSGPGRDRLFGRGDLGR
jgi:hypothetical protein